MGVHSAVSVTVSSEGRSMYRKVGENPIEEQKRVTTNMETLTTFAMVEDIILL